jgi:hypothetical protein
MANKPACYTLTTRFGIACSSMVVTRFLSPLIWKLEALHMVKAMRVDGARQKQPVVDGPRTLAWSQAG